MNAPPRGQSVTKVWTAGCKDCRAEQAGLRVESAGRRKRQRDEHRPDQINFDYSSVWASRTLERGFSRSDRCQRHRRIHAEVIRAIAVPYVDLRVIGQVADTENPTGPLGGLGPLPILHEETEARVDLSRFEFGMSDADILAICKGLANKQFAVIEAGTGTGKSTFMPFRLMNPPEGAAIRLAANGPIIVTEPRTQAAKGVARFVGEDLCFGHDNRTCSAHIGPGYRVGYQVHGDKHWDSACDLIYVTDGTMINWVREGRLSSFGAVIIDEAHERSENIDIILAQLRDLAPRFPNLKVIITSATLDRAFFVEYFGGEDKVFHHSVPAIKSFGYGVPLFVGLKVDPSLIKQGLVIAPEMRFEGWSEPSKDDVSKREDPRAETRRLEALRCVDEIPIENWRDRMPGAVAKQVVAIAEGTDWGDILAFLPTSAMISDAVNQIEQSLNEREFDVYPLLSTTDPKISDKAVAARSRGDKRKVVVSSNLAETSLTVKGVRYVVDSGLICQSEWDPALASGAFPTKKHSQSGLRQRWGRVGRDQPGWVFPLYTAEQFLSLPKNTPPGSTQINLEAFYMKLISAGLDPETAVLPANFEHPSVVRDEDGVRSRDVFNLESARAMDALRLGGALDEVGRLTDFGREIERFSGQGSEALAMMLGDQLACAHETALALEVLGQGLLYNVGNRPPPKERRNRASHSTKYLLMHDWDWPAAWRVRAAQHHAALALGCVDDLDLMLRIFRLWQDAPDRRAWCKTWWINESVLREALDAVDERLWSLSAGMRGKAQRPTDPGLGERVRAVLTRALVSARYVREGEAGYRAASGTDVTLAGVAKAAGIKPGDTILALQRFRPAAKDDNVQPAVISHFVEAAEWAMAKDTGAANLGLELIARCSERRQTGRVDVGADLTASVRIQLPIGTTIAFEAEAPRNGVCKLRSVDIKGAPFVAPVEGKAPRAARAPPSGFDRDWTFDKRRLGETPEEELRPEPDEEDEENATMPSAARADRPTLALPNLFVARAFGALEAPCTGRAVITGYRVIDPQNIVLLVDPVSPEQALDPARHDDLALWQRVEVVVAGLVCAQGLDHLQLERRDGRGRFYLGVDEHPGVNSRDRDFLQRLKSGAVLSGRTLPNDNDPMSVSLLPAAWENLRSAAKSVVGVRSGHKARVLDQTEARWPVIELEARDERAGLTHQFAAVRRLLEPGVSTTPHAVVLAELDFDEGRGRRRELEVEPDQAKRLVSKYAQVLKASGKYLRASGPLDQEVIYALLDLNKKPAWQVQVWRFYDDSLHRDLVRVSKASPSLTLQVDRRVSSRLHHNEEARRSLEARPGITTINPQFGKITIAGESDAAIRAVAAAILKPVVGNLVLPEGRGAGRLIGPQGQTINALREATGCDADNPDRGPVWTIRGPDENSVRAFFDAAKGHVFGATGEILRVERIDDFVERSEVRAETAMPALVEARQLVKPDREAAPVVEEAVDTEWDDEEETSDSLVEDEASEGDEEWEEAEPEALQEVDGHEQEEFADFAEEEPLEVAQPSEQLSRPAPPAAPHSPSRQTYFPPSPRAEVAARSPSPGSSPPTRRNATRRVRRRGMGVVGWLTVCLLVVVVGVGFGFGVARTPSLAPVRDQIERLVESARVVVEQLMGSER